jgi:hypothetical protein
MLRFVSVEGSREHRKLTVSFHLNCYCAQDRTAANNPRNVNPNTRAIRFPSVAFFV